MVPLRKMNRNVLFGILLLIGITFSVVTIVTGTAPDPGHDFTQSSGGVVQGNLLYGSDVDTLLALPKDTNATRYLSNTGASNNPAWAQVNLANGVTGALVYGNIAAFAGLGDCDTAATSKLLWDVTTGVLSCGTDQNSAASGWTDDGAAVRLTTVGDNVGIGTATLTEKLEVVGNASVSGTGYFGGNVGIGTITPQKILDVYKSDSGTDITTGQLSTLRITNPDTTNGNYSSLEFATLSDTAVTQVGARYSVIYTSHTGGAQSADFVISLRNAGTIGEKMRILSTGNVGIGTTPQAKLDVLSTTEQLRLTYDASNYASFTVGSTGSLTTNLTGSGQSYGFNSAGGMTVGSITNAAAAINLKRNSVILGGMTTTNNVFSLFGGTTAANHLTINSSGNVGIGTTIVDAKLEVAGTASVSALTVAGVDITGGGGGWTDDGAAVRLTTIGDTVGIGDATPDAKLDVAGSGIFDNELMVSGALQVGHTATVAYSRFGTATTGHLLTGADDLLIGDLEVDATGWFDGNVGIGITGTIDAKLSIEKNTALPWNGAEGDWAIKIVDGTADVGLLLGVSAAGDASAIQSMDPSTGWTTRPLLLQPNGGNVGIGTTTPDQKLEVAGTILASTSGNVDMTLNSTTSEDTKFTFRSTGASDRFEILGSVSQNYLTILKGGSVGIGITNPANTFVVGKAGATNANFEVAIATGITAQSYNRNTSAYATYNIDGSTIGFRPNGSIMTTINTTGVGIGTTIVDAKLEVAGTASVSALTVAGVSITGGGSGGWTDDGAAVRLTTVGDNVGIGTATPDAKLDVAGNILASTSGAVDLTLNNTAQAYGKFILRSMAGPNAGRLDIIGGAAGATTLVSIASTGNMGLGTTRPGYKLDIADNSASGRGLNIAQSATSGAAYGLISDATGASSQNTGGYFGASGATTNFGVYIGTPAAGASNYALYSAATAQSYFAGNVGIGMTAPTAKLDVRSPMRITRTAGNGYQYDMAADDTNLKLSYYSAAATLFTDNILVTTYLGNVGIGKVPGAQLDLSTDSARKLTTTTWATGSDSRIKTNIQDIDNALDIIRRVRPVKYHYDADFLAANPSVVDTDYYNFIAQEYQQVFPESVTESEGLLYMNSSNMIPYAIAGVKALDQQIAQEVSTKTLCVSDDTGAKTCITKNQLDALIASAGSSARGTPTPTPAPTPVTGTPEESGTPTSIPEPDATEPGTPAPITAAPESDTTAPVISLIGQDTINLDISDMYDEQGATVTDDVDTLVFLEISGVVDTETAGTYTIHYNAADTAGNDASEVDRTVIVSGPAPGLPETGIPIDERTLLYIVVAMGIFTGVGYMFYTKNLANSRDSK